VYLCTSLVFIDPSVDGKGDCKGNTHLGIFLYLSLTCYSVGDFGLATSSLAAVDPSDVSPRVVAPEADMTLGMKKPF
jgi:hypothetical protein